jgi:manganese/zinc/iron transport system substrate-binding protein
MLVVVAGTAAAQVTVVTTTSMIADAVRQVGGDRVAVTALMGPGVDPHAYRQTRSDIAAMVQADLVLWHGLYLEAQLEDFLLDLGKRQTVVAVGEGVPDAARIAHDDYAGRHDPHVWMDPELWPHVVMAVRDALIEADPDGTAAYRAGADRHLNDIAELERYATARLATVPQASRVLVTAHDAFNYFGAAFGFEVMGIQGISTESEAGLRRIEELVDTLVTRSITAVFVESSVSERNVRALIEGAAARDHSVTIGGELFSDAMGPSGTYEGTYIGMIDHNVTAISRALGGEAPARGMNGRLAAGS